MLLLWLCSPAAGAVLALFWCCYVYSALVLLSLCSGFTLARLWRGWRCSGAAQVFWALFWRSLSAAGFSPAVPRFCLGIAFLVVFSVCLYLICSGSAMARLALFWRCSSAALVILLWSCSRSVLVLLWALLWRGWRCFCCCSGVAWVILSWCCFRSVLVLLWPWSSGAGDVPALLCCCRCSEAREGAARTRTIEPS